MTDYWFKPKAYGYGATPINWKGWMATFGFMALVLVMTLALMVWPSIDGPGPQTWQIVTWLILDVALLIAFIWVTRVKTDGEWKWRWGRRS